MKKKLKRILIGGSLLGFLLLNIVAFSHAWRFTHFGSADTPRTADPEELSLAQKANVLFTGVVIPKPRNTDFPASSYSTVWIPSREGKKMEGWWMTDSASIGTVLLFHGYAGKKSSLLPEAAAFLKLGYNCLLVDMLGHGGSPGETTSMGVGEAEDIIASVNYVRDSLPDSPLIIYGFSMGSVVALHAAAQTDLQADALIIGCPFGSMLAAVENRFDLMGIPSFPAAELLVFWGGLQQGFWGFGNNAVDYAREVEIPVLLMFGDADERVQMAETQAVFDALAGPRQLEVFPGVAHKSYYNAQPERWQKAVHAFLDTLPRKSL